MQTYRLYQGTAPRGIGSCESPLAQVLALDHQLTRGVIGRWSLLGRHRVLWDRSWRGMPESGTEGFGGGTVSVNLAFAGSTGLFTL